MTTALVFGNISKHKFSGGKSLQRPSAKFFAVTKIKIARIAEFTTSKFFTFNGSFHFIGLNWFLKCAKHTILVLQKQLICTKYFLIYTHFAVGLKCIFSSYHCAKFPHLLNKTSFQTNKTNVQKHREIRMC